MLPPPPGLPFEVGGGRGWRQSDVRVIQPTKLGLIYSRNQPILRHGPGKSVRLPFQMNDTTLNGGSLGSWVDEDRSELRVGM